MASPANVPNTDFRLKSVENLSRTCNKNRPPSEAEQNSELGLENSPDSLPESIALLDKLVSLEPVVLTLRLGYLLFCLT